MTASKDTVQDFGAPVLAVCGFSGSGKTTLLESVIPALVNRGLAVAVVKHDAHGFQVDRPGKDSDRLFRAGATITLSGAGQQFERRAGASLSLQATLARLAADHDLILVEGHKDTALPKLWLGSAEQPEPPDGVENILHTLPWNSDRPANFMQYVESWLPAAWTSRPLYGGLLVGGKSLRMGEPKQLLRFGGQPLGEIAARALGASCEKTLALGPGALPDALHELSQLPDAPGFGGPGAGLIAAHRWAPQAAWIVAACDHPWLRSQHISWLAAQRQPGRWAIIPKQSDGHPCPMLALYEPQALEALDRYSCADPSHNARIWKLLALPGTLSPQPPSELACGWTNVNTPEELRTEEQRLTQGAE